MYENELHTIDGIAICRECAAIAVRNVQINLLEENLTLVRDLGLCAYCGEYAHENDHVVAKVHKQPTWTVPTCAECNNLALGTLFYSFVEKRDYIHTQLKDKYAKVLNTYQFTDKQLQQFGYNLNQAVTSALEAKTIIMQRLNFRLEYAIIQLRR